MSNVPNERIGGVLLRWAIFSACCSRRSSSLVPTAPVVLEKGAHRSAPSSSTDGEDMDSIRDDRLLSSSSGGVAISTNLVQD